MTSSATTSSLEKYLGNPPQIYERHFVPAIGAPFARHMLQEARLEPGERVLDLACGTGVIARLAAEEVGPHGTVAGVDLNPGMLQIARSTTPAAQIIDWHGAPAESLPIADRSCDVVVCSLGFQFFADKPAALREAHRVLVPGGRLLIGTPGPTPAVFEGVRRVLRRHLGPGPASFVDAVFCVYEASEVRELLADAGFADVHATTGVITFHLPGPADLLWMYVQSTPLASALQQADETTRTAMDASAVRELEPFARGDAIVTDIGTLVAGATRPEG